MTRQEACELLSSSSCAEIGQRSNACSAGDLNEWNTQEWRDRLGLATPDKYCEALIKGACCQESGSGATDCKQHIEVTRAESVVAVAANDPSTKEPGFMGTENHRAIIDRENHGRVNFDKLSTPLGASLISCARRASESGACKPSELDWLATCVANK